VVLLVIAILPLLFFLPLLLGGLLSSDARLLDFHVLLLHKVSSLLGHRTPSRCGTSGDYIITF